jgi:hypothetical protein
MSTHVAFTETTGAIARAAAVSAPTVRTYANLGRVPYIVASTGVRLLPAAGRRHREANPDPAARQSWARSRLIPCAAPHGLALLIDWIVQEMVRELREEAAPERAADEPPAPNSSTVEEHLDGKLQRPSNPSALR